MAVRADVVLLADGGDVTVSRDAATFVYGEFKVIIPQGREQVETDRRLQDGYIYRPSMDISQFDIGFSRADVTIDLEVQSTDLELVVDQAQRNAAGDVFFERDITPAGLGEYVPGVDFQVGDVVSVDLRGRRMLLPVSEISMVSSESDGVAGWHVRVGGVLISDADELRRRYDAVRRQVANDKRELARSAGQAATAASRAQSTANTARGEVQAVRDTLAGEQAQEPDLLTQLVAVNDELQRLGQAPQPSLMLAFVSLSTALWEAQQEIDAAQDDFAAQTREQADAQGELLDAVQAQVGEAAQSIWSLGTAGDGFWAVSGDTVTATGTWVGEAILDVTRQYTQRVVHRAFSDGGGSTTDITLEERTAKKVQVGTTRSWTFPSNVSALLAHYRQARGRVAKWDRAIAQQVAGVSWTRLVNFTVTGSAPHSVDFTVGWDAAHRGATYGVRVVVDGVVRKTLSTTKLGPVFPTSDGYRTQRVSVTLDLVPGQVVEFQVMCDHEGESQRTVRDGSARVWWVEN